MSKTRITLRGQAARAYVAALLVSAKGVKAPRALKRLIKEAAK